MGSRSNISIAVALLLIVQCFGQESPPPAVAPQPEKPRVTRTALEVESITDIPFVTSPFIAAPVVCGGDRSIFVRTASSGAVGNLIAISSDGKWTTSFDLNKMTDIVDPSATTFFVRDVEVYLLVRGSLLEGELRRLRRPDGSLETQPLHSDTRYYVAHFKSDGTYMGAVSLDIPMVPLQIGVFQNGDFLIAGTTKDRQQARVALVKSNGQFDRFIELKDDIRIREEADPTGADPAALPRIGKRFGEGFADAVRVSTIIGDGRNLLLVRKGQNSPVFSISAGGKVESTRLNVPDGYRLWDIRTTRDFWVALYMHRISDAAGVEFSSMAIEPNTGKVLEAYSYERFPGFGLACTDGIEFSFLIRDDNKLRVLKLISSHRSSSRKQLEVFGAWSSIERRARQAETFPGWSAYRHVPAPLGATSLAYPGRGGLAGLKDSLEINSSALISGGVSPAP